MLVYKIDWTNGHYQVVRLEFYSVNLQNCSLKHIKDTTMFRYNSEKAKKYAQDLIADIEEMKLNPEVEIQVLREKVNEEENKISKICKGAVSILHFINEIFWKQSFMVIVSEGNRMCKEGVPEDELCYSNNVYNLVRGARLAHKGW